MQWGSILDLDTPLIECLDLFNASNSTIQPRSLINTCGGWSKPDMEALKQFMTTNYADSSSVDWRLADIYMSTGVSECQHVGQGTFDDPLNKVGYRQICELRDSRMGWKDTDVERKQMKDLIEQHMESTARSKLVDIIKQEIPNRPLSDIRLFCRQYVHKLKAGRMSLDQMTQLRELVGEYGEDWDRIGKVLDVLPPMARYSWITLWR
ncbi:hypothetical protein GGF41_001478 [Coemansia sp. RSA 2531]|nr:hypothetical protein GGF41_001478 [Coemansia sp. RSA 2531]